MEFDTEITNFENSTLGFLLFKLFIIIHLVLDLNTPLVGRPLEYCSHMLRLFNRYPTLSLLCTT